MESKIPATTLTAVNPSKEPPKFAFLTNPDHWRMELMQHFCDELHKSYMFLTIVQCLEQEGWRLRASNSVMDIPKDRETSKLFFTRA